MFLGRRSTSIRVRIALTIFAVSTGLLIVMSIAVYVLFNRQLLASLDDTLRLRATANAGLVDTTPPRLSLPAVDGSDSEFVNGEAVLRLYGSDGTLLDNAAPFTVISAEEHQVAADALARGHRLYRTIDLDHDEDFRVVADPVMVGGEIRGVLVTGLERSRVENPLRILRLILVISDILTSIALALGSYWIARRALRPVAKMTATAERITRGDLHERIPGAADRDELSRLAATLNSMLARLGETIERERRFTADASHELRTPLAAIEAGIDVTLSHDRDGTEYQRVLGVIRGQTRRLNALANQLLLLSRLDNEEIRGQFDLVELDGLLHAVGEAFSDAHQDATVRVVNATDVPAVLGDYELLARAITNLLENAVIHARPSVHVDVSVANGTDGMVLVTVQDDGPGIQEHLAPEVFRRFRRGAVSRGGRGLGLGLAIVEAIILAHGGIVRLSPVSTRRGARFEIELPAAS